MNSIFYDGKPLKIQNKIDQYDVISFDVFDTLIKRNVPNPQDLYNIVGELVRKKYGIQDFATNRLSVELRGYSNGENVTLDYIYEQLQKLYSNIDINLLKKLEYDCELSYCQANLDIKEVYIAAKQKGKRVIAISDMYLSKHFINEMLTKCGYDMDEVYVSNEYNALKRKGKLFEKVLKIENITSKQILHIGDSFRADYLGAKCAGIKSVRIKKDPVLFNTKRFIKLIKNQSVYNIHKCIINNNMHEFKSYYSKFGFSIIGPSLFSFCMWILEQSKENGIKEVFFFSRDGFIMKKAFDLLNEDSSIKSHYIYVSRRSLRLPYNAVHSDVNDALKLLPPTNLIKVSTLFEYFNVDVKENVKILEKFNLKANDSIYYKEIKTKYFELVNELLNISISNSKKELDLAVKYLNQEKLSGKFAVVDIGWHQSMQYCLENILNEYNIPNDVYGLYFGIENGGFDVKHTKGFIKEDETPYVYSTNAFIGLIESFFLEQKGTVLKYKYDHDVIAPVRAEYEYEEDSKEYKAYAEIHHGAIRYIELIKNIINKNDLVLNGEDAYTPIKSYGINPYIKDINKFNFFRYYSEDVFYLVGYKGLAHYIVHLKDLKRDLYTCKWKIGFMKKLFKINLPYLSIYKKIRRKA